MAEPELELVVAAVDGSDASLHAARTAVAYARSNGARLHVLTVVRPTEGWWGIGGAGPAAEAMTHALESAQHVLDETTAALETDDVDVETSIEIGEPAGTVADFCEKQGADLLVIGRRGAGLFERMTMGSTADRLAHTAPCPVLLVP
ncbi:MAG: universal stress protein [Acidimicrobiia bacterium]